MIFAIVESQVVTRFIRIIDADSQEDALAKYDRGEGQVVMPNHESKPSISIREMEGYD
mgnify:CR=1 FL=1